MQCSISGEGGENSEFIYSLNENLLKVVVKIFFG